MILAEGNLKRLISYFTNLLDPNTNFMNLPNIYNGPLGDGKGPQSPNKPPPLNAMRACALAALGKNWQGLTLDAGGWVANAALPEGSVAAAVVGSTLGVAGIASAAASNDGPVDGVISGSLAYTRKQTALASAMLRGTGAALAGRIGFYALAASTAYDAGKTALAYQSCMAQQGGH